MSEKVMDSPEEIISLDESSSMSKCSTSGESSKSFSGDSGKYSLSGESSKSSLSGESSSKNSLSRGSSISPSSGYTCKSCMSGESSKSLSGESSKSSLSGEPSKSSTVSEEKLLNYLEIIDNSSVKTKEVYRRLVSLRTKLIDKPEGIKLLLKLNAHKIFLKKLSHPNDDKLHEDILHVSISLLSNLTNHLIMREDFRAEVLEKKVPWKIVEILRKTNKPKIHMRIFRLIGNLAQSKDICRELHCAGATRSIVHILTETNVCTVAEYQHLSIRALRWLWEVHRYQNEMLKAGVVTIVAKHCLSMDTVVQKSALRALVRYTQSPSTFVTEQIMAAGDLFPWLVTQLDQAVVPVLICNLSCEPRARIELCKAGLVEIILKQISNGELNAHLITVLCQMCKESMARANLRFYPNGFKIFLSLLQNKKLMHFYSDVLEALAQFVYDNSSLMAMVNSGLIPLLLDKLDEFTKSYCSGHEVMVPYSSGSSLSPTSPPDSWGASPSPPPHSPTTDIFNPEYSPTSFPISDSYCPIPPLERTYTESPLGMDGCILEVLSRLCHHETPFPTLAKGRSIEILLEYISGLPHRRGRAANFSKAARALCAIIQQKHYLTSILDGESVLRIHAQLCRPKHQGCLDCRRLKESGMEMLLLLQNTAQSGLGEGVILYRLTGASQEMKNSAALIIPYVIWKPPLLDCYLMKHRGLKILISLLDSRIEEAVPALHFLCDTLNMENPKQPIEMCSNCEIGRIRKESNIIFKLDDGSTVTANKETLCHSCPMFEAMFRGGFKESVQSTVSLPHISAECFTYLTKLLPEYCSCALPKDVTILLEMISAADRFLLPELMKKIIIVLRDSMLSPSTASQIYDWSVRIGCHHELTEGFHKTVIKYILRSKMLEQDRIHAVSEILNSKNKERFLEELYDIVHKGLSYYLVKPMFFYRKPIPVLHYYPL